MQSFFLTRQGNEGKISENAATGSDTVNDALTNTFITRGSIDLSQNRLPTIDDVAVRPDDPLIAYDCFVVEVGGSVVTGVTGAASLAIGDLLILKVNEGSATAANWLALANSANPVTDAGLPVFPYYGTNNKNVVVCNRRLPFFP